MTTTRLPRWLAALSDQPTIPRHPRPLDVDRGNIPSELRFRDAWAVWRYEADRMGRISKPPYQPDGTQAEASESSTWSPFEAAYATFQHGSWDGVSFALSLRWGIVGIDLDHISDHRREAEEIARTLHSYTERSPGGDGLRIFVKGSLPLGRRRRDWVEAYTTRRFLTVTGQRLEGFPRTIESRPSELAKVFWDYLGQDAASIKRSLRRGDVN